jgi:hypothetical protein
MPLLRLAYSTLYLIALVAIFLTWSQAGGQSHLDLLPWWIKLALGMATAFTIVRSAAAAVAGEKPWNGQTLKWLGLTVALGVACGMATYYAHTYLEETDEPDSEAEPAISRLIGAPEEPLVIRKANLRAHATRLFVARASACSVDGFVGGLDS